MTRRRRYSYLRRALARVGVDIGELDHWDAFWKATKKGFQTENLRADKARHR